MYFCEDKKIQKFNKNWFWFTFMVSESRILHNWGHPHSYAASTHVYMYLYVYIVYMLQLYFIYKDDVHYPLSMELLCINYNSLWPSDLLESNHTIAAQHLCAGETMTKISAFNLFEYTYIRTNRRIDCSWRAPLKFIFQSTTRYAVSVSKFWYLFHSSLFINLFCIESSNLFFYSVPN